MASLTRIVPGLMLAALLMGAGEAPSGADVLARRGDVQITRAELNDALAALDPVVRARILSSPQSLAAFTRERILNQAVLAEAKAQSWDKQPEIARRIADAANALIIQSYLMSKVKADPLYPSEAEVMSAYELNKARLMAPRQFHVAQIVLTVKADATPQEDEAVHKRASELRTQVTRPRADFAEYAQKNSQDKATAANGGDVGWLREPDLLPLVHETLLKLSDAEISQPVRMPDGWHLFKLVGVQQAGPIPLLDAKPRVVDALRQQRAQAQMKAYVETMVQTQGVEVNELELAKSMPPPSAPAPAAK